MRLARIAHPDGVAFVTVDGPAGAEQAKEILDHPFGTPTYTGRAGRQGRADLRSGRERRGCARCGTGFPWASCSR